MKNPKTEISLCYEISKQIRNLNLLFNIGISNIKQIMRRRSGAIHSQTEQQFVLLAEKALDKNGIFYDQKLNIEEPHSQDSDKKKQNQQVKTNPFLNFDFDQIKQLEKDERELDYQIKKQPQINIKNVVICDQASPVVQILSNMEASRAKDCDMDLVIRKIGLSLGGIGIMKYWVIKISIIHQPLAEIYMKSAANIFWTSLTSCTIPSAKQCTNQQLLWEVSKLESQYMK